MGKDSVPTKRKQKQTLRKKVNEPGERKKKVVCDKTKRRKRREERN